MTAAVNRRITSGGAAHLPLEAADHDGWLPSYAVANCYANGDAGLGQQCDRLTRLGPLPIIASLSLGATRTFRLHRTQHPDLLGGASNGGDPGSAGSRAGGGGAAAGAGAGASSATAQAPTAAAGAEAVQLQVDIPLPHNALLIMWPPTQEAWKHEMGAGAARVCAHSQCALHGCRPTPAPARRTSCQPAAPLASRA